MGLIAIAGLFGFNFGLAGASSASVHSHYNAITNYLKYVGGRGKANPKLAPITIGAVNQQTSTGAIAPMWTTGVKVAAEYINQHTHGIDGHPVRVAYCAIPTTVGSAAKCGQEFANNPKIAGVIAGAIDVGNTALESALKPSKKPIFWDVSLSAVDEKEPQGFIWWSTDAYVNGADATFARKVIHAKSVSVVYPSTTPAEVTQAQIVAAGLKYEGIKTTSVGFTGKAANLTEPLNAAGVSHSTLLIAIDSGGPTCSDLALSLKSLSLSTKVKVETNLPCAAPTVAKADGGQLPHGWYYESSQAMPAGAKTKSLTVVAKRIFAQYRKGPLYANPWSEMGFSELLTVAKLDTTLVKAHKHVTPRALFTAARAFKGPVLYGPPDLRCGAYKTPATCNDLSRFFQNLAPSSMKLASTWIGPPKGFGVARSRR